MGRADAELQRWNVCMDSLNLNSDCNCCERGMGVRDWTEGAYLHLSPVSLRACLPSRGYLLSARQWLSVPAEMPELQETELAVFQRRANIPWDAAASLAEAGSLSPTAVCGTRNLPKKRIFLKETTLCISNENNCWPQMSHRLQVSWILFRALCKSSLGTFQLNEPGSSLSLFWPRWKEASLFSLFLEAFLLSQTQPVKRGKGCACPLHCCCAWNDDGKTRNPKKLC